VSVGIVVRDGYAPIICNAYRSTRLGYLHGFQKIGLRADFVEHGELAGYVAVLPSRPLLWLTCGDYYHLDDKALEAIRECPHIVQVNTWFEGMAKLHASFGAPSPQVPEDILGKIVASEPDFVWCSAPEPYLDEFYAGWLDAGLRVVSLPWACDSTKYVDGETTRGGSVDVAFVGGYRPYKEPQYEICLWPYEDRLKVWGYSKWPRCYQGVLPEERERDLYETAIVCPTISEPQFAVTGDTVERPFKVLGSGGLTVFDPVPAYRHLFSSDEALLPENDAEYHEMMDLALYDRGANLRYRIRGREAVLSRHCYHHRAQQIVKALAC
jgi:hypothetical protein